MNEDPQSILERLDVRSVESEIGQLLDAGVVVLDSLVAVARGVVGQASISVDDREHVEEAAREWVANVGFDSFEEAFMRERIVTCGNPGGLYELWGSRQSNLRDVGT